MKKFEQLKSLFSTMKRVYAISSDSEMYVSGITSDFDRLFELCWKTLKEYLKSAGFQGAKTGSPRDIIKLAYREGLVNDGDFWLEMLEERNDDSHHYNESSARSYAAKIEWDYLPFIQNFISDMVKLIPEEKDILIKIPKSFLEAKAASGLRYDRFLDKVLKENGFESELELFENWDLIKDQYVNKGNVPDSDFSL